jgi:hypothetical protein
MESMEALDSDVYTGHYRKPRHLPQSEWDSGGASQACHGAGAVPPAPPDHHAIPSQSRTPSLHQGDGYPL